MKAAGVWSLLRAGASDVFAWDHSADPAREEEIIRVIWPDTFVEEGNLARYISTLRRILGENPGEHPYILTIPKHGYRFVAAVREAGGSRSTQTTTARLSIAVLPFKHLITAQRDQLLEVDSDIECRGSGSSPPIPRLAPGAARNRLRRTLP